MVSGDVSGAASGGATVSGQFPIKHLGYCRARTGTRARDLRGVERHDGRARAAAGGGRSRAGGARRRPRASSEGVAERASAMPASNLEIAPAAGRQSAHRGDAAAGDEDGSDVALLAAGASRQSSAARRRSSAERSRTTASSAADPVTEARGVLVAQALRPARAGAGAGAAAARRRAARRAHPRVAPGAPGRPARLGGGCGSAPAAPAGRRRRTRLPRRRRYT